MTPRKVREIIADLLRAGFVNRGGKGSHRNFLHSSGQHVTLSGQPGSDAYRYQERKVQQVIQDSLK